MKFRIATHYAWFKTCSLYKSNKIHYLKFSNQRSTKFNPSKHFIREGKDSCRITPKSVSLICSFCMCKLSVIKNIKSFECAHVYALNMHSAYLLNRNKSVKVKMFEWSRCVLEGFNELWFSFNNKFLDCKSGIVLRDLYVKELLIAGLLFSGTPLQIFPY